MVEFAGPLWTTTARPATSGAAVPDASAASSWHGQPGSGPVSPRQDLAVLAGATGTTSAGGNAGGSPGQADLPGGSGLGARDGGRAVLAERWQVRPWCYVFGRHHPS
ncbi:hypothetical protein GCM10009634_38240 [Saccharothrix xinjiangensis]